MLAASIEQLFGEDQWSKNIKIAKERMKLDRKIKQSSLRQLRKLKLSQNDMERETTIASIDRFDNERSNHDYIIKTIADSNGGTKSFYQKRIQFLKTTENRSYLHTSKFLDSKLGAMLLKKNDFEKVEKAIKDKVILSKIDFLHRREERDLCVQILLEKVNLFKSTLDIHLKHQEVLIAHKAKDLLLQKNISINNSESKYKRYAVNENISNIVKSAIIGFEWIQKWLHHGLLHLYDNPMKEVLLKDMQSLLSINYDFENLTSANMIQNLGKIYNSQFTLTFNESVAKPTSTISSDLYKFQWLVELSPELALGETFLRLYIHSNQEIVQGLPRSSVSPQNRIVLFGPSDEVKKLWAQSLNQQVPSLKQISLKSILERILKHDTSYKVNLENVQELITIEAMARYQILNGETISDKIATQLIAWETKSSEQGFIIIDYPNTFEQARLLMIELSNIDYSIDLPSLDSSLSEFVSVIKRPPNKQDATNCGIDHAILIQPENKSEGQLDYDLIQFYSKLGILKEGNWITIDLVSACLQPLPVIDNEFDLVLEGDISQTTSQSSQSIDGNVGDTLRIHKSSPRLTGQPIVNKMIDHTPRSARSADKGVDEEKMKQSIISTFKILYENLAHSETLCQNYGTNFFETICQTRFNLINQQHNIFENMYQIIEKSMNSRTDSMNQFITTFSGFEFDYRPDSVCQEELQLVLTKSLEKSNLIGDTCKEEVHTYLSSMSKDDFILGEIFKIYETATKFLQSKCLRLFVYMNTFHDYILLISSKTWSPGIGGNNLNSSSEILKRLESLIQEVLFSMENESAENAIVRKLNNITAIKRTSKVLKTNTKERKGSINKNNFRTIPFEETRNIAVTQYLEHKTILANNMKSKGDLSNPKTQSFSNINQSKSQLLNSRKNSLTTTDTLKSDFKYSPSSTDKSHSIDILKIMEFKVKDFLKFFSKEKFVVNRTVLSEPLASSLETVIWYEAEKFMKIVQTIREKTDNAVSCLTNTETKFFETIYQNCGEDLISLENIYKREHEKFKREIETRSDPLFTKFSVRDILWIISCRK